MGGMQQIHRASTLWKMINDKPEGKEVESPKYEREGSEGGGGGKRT